MTLLEDLGKLEGLSDDLLKTSRNKKSVFYV